MTRKHLLLAVLAATALPACKSKPGTDDTAVDSGADTPYSSVDTSEWTDTGDGGAADGGADGGAGDGGSTGPLAVDLDLYPLQMKVVPGSSWDLRVVATFDDGTRTDADAVYTSSDESVATVDETGRVTAVAEGSITITATRDGASDAVAVEVVDGLGVTVRIVDAETGKPHAGARVMIGYEPITADMVGRSAPTDGGATDGGSADGGSSDGGSSDGGSSDGGSADGGSADGGSADGGSADGGSADGGSADGGSADGGSADGGSADGGAEEPVWTQGETDESGEITFTWTSPEPFVITAWARERVPTTVFGVVSRELVVPIRAFADIDESLGLISGPVDMDGIPTGGAGDHKVGIAMPSLLDGPLLLDTDLLVGPSKTVELYGVEAAVPGNLYLRDASEAYSLWARAGQTGVWTVAAPLPIDELTSGLAGATDALEVMLARIEDMVWGWTDGPEIPEGGAGVADLAPSTELTERYTIQVGDLPIGFSGYEDALVLVGESLPAQGFSTTGVGVGTDEVTVYGAAASLGGAEHIVMAAAQVDGLGSGDGNGICTSWAPLYGTEATLPPLQRVPSLYLFNPGSHEFSLETDARAAFVHVLLRGGATYGNEFRDLYFAGGALEDVLPEHNAPFGYGSSTWELVAFETDGRSFHDIVREGWPSDAELAAESWTAGLLTQEP